MNEDNEEQQHELVMPFVTVQSNGGPHEDVAFAAGWGMGHLSAVLDGAVAKLETLGPLRVQVERTVDVDVRSQVDLIAMKCGWTVEFAEIDGYPEYLHAIFQYQSEPLDDASAL